MKTFFDLCRKSLHHFYVRDGFMLASSSSYYGILALIPFSLLMIRGVGYVFGDHITTKQQIFNLGASLVPQGGPEFLNLFQNLVEAPLFASQSATWLNFILLFICSISFLNSLSRGIYSLAGKDPNYPLNHTLKGTLLMAGSVLIVAASLLLPSFVYFIEYIATHNNLVDFLGNLIPTFGDFIVNYQSNSLGKLIFVRTPIFSSLFFLAYFTFVYKWFLGRNIRIKDAFFGSLFFVFFLVLGKYIFLYYIFKIRPGVLGSFGDYYTIVLGFTWIFLFLCFFFLGASFTHMTKMYVDSKLPEPSEY